MPDTPATEAVDNDTVAIAISDTLCSHLANHPDLRGNGREVECGDYEWSTNGQLLGIVIDGDRFTVTVTRVETSEAAPC